MLFYFLKLCNPSNYKVLDINLGSKFDTTAKLVREILWKIRDNGSIIILACHDGEELEFLSDEIYTISEGKIVSHDIIEKNSLMGQ